jgi:hypothetical protein
MALSAELSVILVSLEYSLMSLGYDCCDSILQVSVSGLLLEARFGSEIDFDGLEM